MKPYIRFNPFSSRIWLSENGNVSAPSSEVALDCGGFYLVLEECDGKDICETSICDLKYITGLSRFFAEVAARIDDRLICCMEKIEAEYCSCKTLQVCGPRSCNTTPKLPCSNKTGDYLAPLRDNSGYRKEFSAGKPTSPEIFGGETHLSDFDRDIIDFEPDGDQLLAGAMANIDSILYNEDTEYDEGPVDDMASLLL